MWFWSPAINRIDSKLLFVSPSKILLFQTSQCKVDWHCGISYLLTHVQPLWPQREWYFILCFISQLRNGNVHYISEAGVGGKVERTVGDAVLSDGHWHTLRLVKNGSATVLQVDGSHSRFIQHATQDFGGLGVLTFSLGGIPNGPGQQKTAAGEAAQFMTEGYNINVFWLMPARLNSGRQK